MAPFVVPLRDLRAGMVPLAGGKAANLGELAAAGFPVPDGFCLTTEAYDLLVAANGMGPAISAHLAALDVQSPEALAAAGAAIRDLFAAAVIPAEVLTPLLDAVAGMLDSPLAVRSSATAEDLPEASFAGQQETFLNVLGEEQILAAVRRCWASLWTDRAIAYRARNGIPHERVSLAVVVQRLVPAEVAGVAFTANPVTGKRTELVIDASPGLGEAVVSGAVSPDNFVVEKRGFSIVSRQVRRKGLAIVPVSEGGTQQVTLAGDRGAAQALPDEKVAELARLCARVEEHFGWPQDVEWAYAGGQLFLLQSRPITSLFPVPPGGRGDDLRVYVSANAIQGMLEPFTPLGASIFAAFGQEVFGKRSNGGPTMHVLANRIYADATDMLRNPFGRAAGLTALSEGEPVTAGILKDLLREGLLGVDSGSPQAAGLRFVRRNAWFVVPIVFRVFRNVSSPAWTRKNIHHNLIPRLDRWRAQALEPWRLGEQPAVARRILRHGLGFTLFPNFVPVVASGVFPFKVAERLATRWGLDISLLPRTRQALPDNVTTEMDLRLWELARATGADAEARARLVNDDDAALAAAYREGGLPDVFQRGLAEFLGRYGHRGVREIDIGMPRWREEPQYLFGVLRGLVLGDERLAAPDEHFARLEAQAEAAVSTLVSQARRQRLGGRLKAAVLGFLLRRFRANGGLRELPKFLILQMFDDLRSMLLDAGRQLVEAGWLERKEDVVFLSLDEIERAKELRGELRGLVEQHRREYERELRRARAPRVLTSEGEAFYGSAKTSQAGDLAGTAVSPGTVRGRARIVRDPKTAQLEPGEVMVAPSTDPAWTPLFLTAAGLVMETGGMMSHGSVVAREYGIPAVVGVAEATTHIKNGQLVEVDGNQGLVRLLDKA